MVQEPIEPKEVASEPPNQASEIRRRFLNWRTLLAFLVAIGLVAFAIWRFGVDPRAVWEYMRTANPWLYLLGFLCFYLTFPLRAWRWRLLLQNASAQDLAAPPIPQLPGLTEIIFLSWFANCVVPAKLGDLYRGYLLKQTNDSSFSRTVGTIFAERVLDMLFLFALMIGASLAIFGPQMPETATAKDKLTASAVYGGGGLLVVVAAGALVGLRFFGPTMRRWVPSRFQGLYDRFLEGTLLSFRGRTLPLLLGQTLSIWILESLRFYFVLHSLPQNLSLSFPVVVFIALASSLLTTLPISPAGLGAVEWMFVWILPIFLSKTMSGLVDPANLAGAVAMLDRIINYWSILILGFVVFLVSKKGLRALFQKQ